MNKRINLFIIFLFIGLSLSVTFNINNCAGGGDDSVAVNNNATSTSYSLPPIPTVEDFANPIFQGVESIDIGDQFKATDENGYPIPLSRRPTVTWETKGEVLEVAAIFSKRVQIKVYSDGRQEIANFSDCVWAWHSNMPSSKKGFVEYDEGSAIVNREFPEYQIYPEPLEVRLYDINKSKDEQNPYYIVIWAFNEKGEISSASALWEFYTRPDES